MSFKEKFIREIKVIIFTSLYFFTWFGVLVFLKELMLEEYQIAFYGFSMVIVGALVAAKVVLILENVPIGTWTKNKPAIVEIVTRTLLYLIGVFIVLVLEKSFEARNEYGGFINAMGGLEEKAAMNHIIVNTIGVSGAILGFNIWSVAKKHLGKGGMWRILSRPIPKHDD